MHAIEFIHQFLRYPPGTYFMELKVIMYHRISRHSVLQFCWLSLFYYKESDACPYFILCGHGCGWISGVFCIRLTHTVFFLNILVLPHTTLPEREHYSHIQHTHADAFVHLVHLPTKIITDHCCSLVLFSHFTAMFTTF